VLGFCTIRTIQALSEQFFAAEVRRNQDLRAGDSDEEASKEGFLGAGKLVASSGDAGRARSSLGVRQVFDSPFPAPSTLFSHWTPFNAIFLG
jgi:hypothetical protein